MLIAAPRVPSGHLSPMERLFASSVPESIAVLELRSCDAFMHRSTLVLFDLRRWTPGPKGRSRQCVWAEISS